MGPRPLAAALLLLAATAYAVAPLPTHFSITPDKSSITFAAVENHVTVTGHFTKFSGEVVFDPAALATSSAKVTVDLASVSSDGEGVVDNLKTPDWFDTARFPQSVFEVRGFKALGHDEYEADGALSIKGVPQKLALHFIVHTRDTSGAYVTGDTTVSRVASHVGWADTGTVEDKVKVTIDIHAAAVK